MGATYQDMLDTPWKQILQDLEFIDLEATYLKPKEPS